MSRISEKYGLPEALPMMPPAPSDDNHRVVAVELLGLEPEYNSNSRSRTIQVLKLIRADGSAVLIVSRHHDLEAASRSHVGKLALSREEADRRASEAKAKRMEAIRRSGSWK